MRLVAAALLAALAAPSAFASAYWTDWTSAAASSVSGTLSVGSSNVSVVYSGPYSGAQTAGGTNYWVPNVYTSATVPSMSTVRCAGTPQPLNTAYPVASNKPPSRAACGAGSHRHKALDRRHSQPSTPMASQANMMM